MVLMAIDHVRVYSGVPAGGPTAGIFFTRWVTHFCAPAFVVPRGHRARSCTARKLGGPRRAGALSRHARADARAARADRDSRSSWTFNLALLGTSSSRASSGCSAGAWCSWRGSCGCRRARSAILGLCVDVLPAGLRRGAGAMPTSIRNAVGRSGTSSTRPARRAGTASSILYTLVPWIGVMAAGYAFGAILLREPDERRRLCLRIGLSATALFRACSRRVFLFVAPAGDDAGPVALPGARTSRSIRRRSCSC